MTKVIKKKPPLGRKGENTDRAGPSPMYGS